MGIKTVPQPPYSPDLAPCDFWLFPKHTGCNYETIEAMKEAVTKVIDTLTQEDFHGAFQKLLEWYNKCIAAGGDYFEADKNFMYVLKKKVPIRKMSGNLFNDPCIYVYIYIYIYLNKSHSNRKWRSPSYGRASFGRIIRTYIQQLCTDTGCSLEEAMDHWDESWERERERERERESQGNLC